MFTGTQLLDSHSRVVVGHATQRVRDAAFDDYIALGPVNLQVAAGDWCQENRSFESADVVGERDAIVLAQVQNGCILNIDQHRITRRAVERVQVCVNQLVELFSTPRGNNKCLRQGAVCPRSALHHH